MSVLSPRRALEGELRRVSTAHTDELEAVQQGNTGATAVHIESTVGKRARETELAYRKAKKGESDLTGGTNALSSALDEMLTGAANRATWAQRRTPLRKAVWSLLMATRTVPLNFLKQSDRWPMPRPRRKLPQLPHIQRELMSA